MELGATNPGAKFLRADRHLVKFTGGGCRYCTGVVHFAFLVGLVIFAHYPKIVFGLMLFFLGIVHAYEYYQDLLILRESLLVDFFLAGLVVLGGNSNGGCNQY